MRDLVHGPRPEQNNLRQLCTGDSDNRSKALGTMPTALVSWSAGPKQDGGVTLGQISCSGVQGVLSLDQVAK